MQNLILQNIVEDIYLGNLPIKWQDFDFKSFSKNKYLFDFQQKCLQNTLKALWLYFVDQNSNKENLFNIYKNNGYDLELDYNLKEKEDNQSAKLLLEYDKDYPAYNNKISYKYFINRMSFWMATGSGKTLIIVKLLEFLYKLIENKQIPRNEILFLTYRDDLIEQFISHINEFNNYHIDTKINLKSLKEYDEIKRDNPTLFRKNELTIFYYRSDLISDIQKEKLTDFKNYDNNGNWYVILDEAHKGDKEDSKRQIIYSILSRNGFLFNFSATFTDIRDYITCVFNFNLSKFIEEGYGKHIYISTKEISQFKDNIDFSSSEKQKIILQTLILLTYINKFSEKIIKDNFYHKPLMLTLVNSVNTESSDLLLFFKEIEKIAKNDIKDELIEIAKQDILTQINNNSKLKFEDEHFKLEKELLLNIKYIDILKYIINSNSPGAIEVLILPNNKKELIFKLKTSDRPFALIKIGDISKWLKNKLSGYEIIEKYENTSIFNSINKDDSDINILMGSRAFYEGWDSNRPNIILFINIGVGLDAKKFVLQSVGRGVRIEPVKNKRKRLKNLYNSREISEDIYNKIQKFSNALETLIVLGTKADILNDIIAILKEEQAEKVIGTEFIINEQVENKLLLIPTYKESPNVLADEEIIKDFQISEEDFKYTKLFFNYLSDLIVLINYDCDLKTIDKLKDSFSNDKKYYKFENQNTILDPDLCLKRIIDYFNLKSDKLDKFKKLEEEIVHFKRIKYLKNEEINKLLENIKKIKLYGEKKKAIDQLRLDFEKYNNLDLDWYDREKEKIDSLYIKEATFRDLKIKYLANHYYLPVILSEKEKIHYINHIINIKSEVKFIEELENYILEDNNFFTKFNWWLFSKIDEDLDEVYLPYYNPKQNKISKFKPDFIFWLQKDNTYYIIFIDPKGTEYSDAYRKIDGFKKLFEENNNEKIFKYNEFDIKVKLFLKAKDIAYSQAEYREYWFDNFDNLKDKVEVNI